MKLRRLDFAGAKRAHLLCATGLLTAGSDPCCRPVRSAGTPGRGATNPFVLALQSGLPLSACHVASQHSCSLVVSETSSARLLSWALAAAVRPRVSDGSCERIGFLRDLG